MRRSWIGSLALEAQDVALSQPTVVGGESADASLIRLIAADHAGRFR